MSLINEKNNYRKNITFRCMVLIYMAIIALPEAILSLLVRITEMPNLMKMMLSKKLRPRLKLKPNT